MADLSNAYGGDLWEVVRRIQTIPSARARKSMFELKITIQKESLGHIREATTPKEAWDALETLFAKANDYFTKVKSLCHEISKLDLEPRISEIRMRRIIVRGLRPEYNGLMANQETLAKQMASIYVKGEEEALFGFQSGGARQGNTDANRRSWRSQGDVECYNYGKKGHIACDC
ncbi:hypothetical protein AMTRI_Chr06g174700 [Amborella trichopoda]